jgi:hypothetical protein
MPRIKTPATPGIDPGTFRLVAQCLNHYATPGPHALESRSEISGKVLNVALEQEDG